MRVQHPATSLPRVPNLVTAADVLPTARTSVREELGVVAKYEPLADYLAGQPDLVREVRMTFDEVESLVGALPPSAHEHRAWWANDTKVQAQAWRAAGWRVVSVNQLSRRVVFRRV